jgi:hypothetical protein
VLKVPAHFNEDHKPKLPTGYEQVFDERSLDTPVNAPTAVDAYRQMVHLYGTDDTPDPKSTVFRGWKKFENEIVLQAIGYELFRPPAKWFELIPALKFYLTRDFAPVDDPEQDDPEHALIIKTGGAQLGGGIYSGTGYKGELKEFKTGPLRYDPAYSSADEEPHDTATDYEADE